MFFFLLLQTINLQHNIYTEDFNHESKRFVENNPLWRPWYYSIGEQQSNRKKVNDYIVGWRNEADVDSSIHFTNYKRDSYIIDAVCPRFGSGEAKGILNESVRGKDVYLLVDVCNHSLAYTVCGQVNHMSPDDHFQDLKRMIAAISGKARRITVIMPFLYESRQHKRSSRESLDCALALQELTAIGVDNIITFDAHDPRVQNAIPLKSFETVQPTYQFIKAL